MKGLRAKSPLRYHLNATLEAEIWLLGLTTTLEVFRAWLVPLFVGIMNTDTHRKAICPVVHHSELQGSGSASQRVKPSLSFRLGVCAQHCCPVSVGLSSVWSSALNKNVWTGKACWRVTGRQMLLAVLAWPVGHQLTHLVLGLGDQSTVWTEGIPGF